jgi:hypothetical protein
MSAEISEVHGQLDGVSLTRPYSQWFDVIPKLGLSFIDHLFNRLDGAYPHKWRSNFPSQQAIDNWCESWVEAFEDERITPDDVKVGLRECRRRYAWPPSIAEFIQACKPVLDPVVAYHEALAGLEARGKGEVGAWSHRAVYWAAVALKNELLHQTYSQIKDRWAAALRIQFEKSDWTDIPLPRVAIEAPGKVRTSPAKAQALVAEFQANGWGNTVKGDGRQWARNILARPETKSIAVIHAAEQALGLR